MKILMISPSIYPNTIGGMEIYNYHFVHEMIKLKQDVSLLTRKGNRINIRKKYSLYTGNPLLQSFQIILHLLFHKYDIVHVPYCSNSFIASPILKFKKLKSTFKYVIYIHGGGMHDWKEPQLQKEFFENAKEVIAISDPMIEEYSKRFKGNVKKILPIIPFGKSNDSKQNLRRKFGFGEDEKILIYVGSIKPIKGSDFLVDAFIKLGKEFFINNKIKMIFIGDGILKNELEKKISDNNLSNEIIFLGKKSREEIPDYLSAADIFLNASHFEGAPLSIIEALHKGLIVISTDVSGINNIIQNKLNGMLFEKNDFGSFNAALIEIINNKELGKNLAIQARDEAAQKFNSENCFLQHLELYK